MNAIFCATSVMIGFSVLGFNVENLLITLAGLFFSFAFMIGSASSKYVEVCSFSVTVIRYLLSISLECSADLLIFTPCHFY